MGWDGMASLFVLWDLLGDLMTAALGKCRVSAAAAAATAAMPLYDVANLPTS